MGTGRKTDYSRSNGGANLAHAPKLLKRNGGFEDRVTMLKLAAGKRWDVSRHKKGVCVLCEESFTSQRHPMMTCIGIEVHEARNRWKSNMKTVISKGGKLRTLMEEYVRCVLTEEDGELAAVGTYTQRWVNKVDKGKELSTKEKKEMKKLMCAVAQGARGVMRVYTRACCDKSRNKESTKRYVATERELELRQLTMAGFMTKEGSANIETIQVKEKKGKKKTPLKNLCLPPEGALIEREEGIGLVRWER